MILKHIELHSLSTVGMIISDYGDIPHILDQHCVIPSSDLVIPGQKCDDCVGCKVLCWILYHISQSVASILGTTCVPAGYDIELFCCDCPR